ncbi:hypothetical protein [Nocardia sp. NPDC052316]
MADANGDSPREVRDERVADRAAEEEERAVERSKEAVGKPDSVKILRTRD